MDSGLYAACAALMARTESLDTIANNLANVSTAGFRGREASFSSVLAASDKHPLSSVLNRAANSYGVLGAITTDTSEGALTRTGNPLDFAIEGPAFFAVQSKNGTAYTRSGAFQLSQTGQLMTSNGEAVLGEGGTIQVPPGAKLTISADGSVSANGAIMGRLKMVEFAPGTDLQNAGGSLYTAPAASAKAATGSSVQQGMLEGSNVNPVSSVVTLIEAQRSAETMRHALSIVDGEMDKVASQDLPRINS